MVTQLLHVVRPHRAYFGRKDYQQARVVSRMVEDLRFDLEIRCVDTVRGPDGLAMSSRNARLSSQEREVATVISRALSAAKKRALAGAVDVGTLVADLRAALAAEQLLTTEYAEARDAETLALIQDGEVPLDGAGIVIGVAAQVSKVRLFDNVVVSR